MNWKMWLITLVSAMSIGTGIFYLTGVGFGYSFLGMEAGSERIAVQFWGKVSIGLGILLLITMLLRAKMNERINDSQLIIFLGLLFIIQIPPLGLWCLAIILGSIESWAGVTVHALLLLSIVRIMTFGKNREPAPQ